MGDLLGWQQVDSHRVGEAVQTASALRPSRPKTREPTVFLRGLLRLEICQHGFLLAPAEFVHATASMSHSFDPYQRETL